MTDAARFTIPEIQRPDATRFKQQSQTYWWELLYEDLLDAARRGRAKQFTPEIWDANFRAKISDHIMRSILGDEDWRERQPQRFRGISAWAEIKSRLDSCARRRGHFNGSSPCRHAWDQDKRVLIIWLDVPHAEHYRDTEAGYE